MPGLKGTSPCMETPRHFWMIAIAWCRLSNIEARIVPMYDDGNGRG